MGSDRKDSKILFDDARKPSHGRTSGPTRKSTKGQWTPEEDELLRIAVQRFQGKNWKRIAECFKDRTDVQCLHRWQKVLNPELIKGPWTKEEDSLIVELVKKYGAKKWSTIAQHLPGRIGKQCRERWHNHLNPNIIREAWTQEEELVLIRAHQLHGNKWAELTKFLPGRSDNAIKNHWNSSVKKKLEMYLASGLLSQFEVSPLISHSAASSSSMAQQSDDSLVGVKFEEISEYNKKVGGVVCLSQSKHTTIMHLGEECKVTKNSSPTLCCEDQYPELEEATVHIPEEQGEAGDKLFERDLSLFLSLADFQEDPEKLPDVPLLDIGEVPILLLPSSAGSDHCKVIPLLIAFSDGLSSESKLDADEHMENLLKNSSTLASQSCHMPPDQFIYSSQENAEASAMANRHDDFIYSRDSNSSPTEDECYKMKNLARLVAANDFVLVPSNDSKCSPSKEADIKTDEQESGSLCYEPPRFPSLDVPFFSCDLQSSSDMQQDFSPFGIRQLMSSSMTPLSLWDSPSRDDTSEAALGTAAKTFSSTPSILKKRHRDLVSPLSERRDEKKLEGASKQEPISTLTNDFSRLNMKLCECVCKEGSFPVSPNKINLEDSHAEKENELPSRCQTGDNLLPKEHQVVESLDKTTNEARVVDLRNAVKTGNDLAGVLAEHNVNNLRFSSTDRLCGIKNDEETDISPRQLGNLACQSSAPVSKEAVLPSPEKSRLPAIPSPCMGTKTGATSFVQATPLPSSTPVQKVESTCKGTVSESNRAYIDTPLKRSLESPSAWKSPWFLNTFIPGHKIDSDITLEDISYFFTGDCGYDAIGLMKQLGEHTAAAFADAQELLRDETPDTILKEIGIPVSNVDGNKVESSSLNSQTEQQNPCSSHPYSSNFTVERRTLDFSECASPDIK